MRITNIGVAWMIMAMWMNFNWLFSLFVPMIVIYFGLCFILANASALAMSAVNNKAHGSSVMSFINMGAATLVVFSLSLAPMSTLLLPLVYFVLSITMLALYQAVVA